MRSPSLPQAWAQKTACFLLACLGCAALMRLMLRRSDFLYDPGFGLLLTFTGITLAWFSLKTLRFAAPLRSAAALGICAAVAGAGIFILLIRALVYLFPPFFG